MAEQFHGLATSSSGGGREVDHENSLIKQGFLPPRKKVSLPSELKYIFDMFLELRFAVNNEGKLVPRDELTYGSIADYISVMQCKISPTEVKAILSSDGIYNTQSAN